MYLIVYVSYWHLNTRMNIICPRINYHFFIMYKLLFAVESISSVHYISRLFIQSVRLVEKFWGKILKNIRTKLIKSLNQNSTCRTIHWVSALESYIVTFANVHSSYYPENYEFSSSDLLEPIADYHHFFIFGYFMFQYKKYKLQFSKAVNTPINAIAPTSGSHLRDKLQKLSNLLSGKSVEITGGQRLSTKDHQAGLIFCMDLMAEKLIVSSTQHHMTRLIYSIAWQK